MKSYISEKIKQYGPDLKFLNIIINQEIQSMIAKQDCRNKLTREIISRKNMKYWYQQHVLKSLGPIDRKFHDHGKNDGFVFYEFIIKQCSSFCKYTNISVMKKKHQNK